MATAVLCGHLAGGVQSPGDDEMMRSQYSIFRTDQRRRKQLAWRSGGGARASASTTLYDLLAVPRSVNLAEIKSAYRRMAKVYHPDVCPPANTRHSSQKFMAVQEAYETLSDPHLRALYDQRLLNNHNHRSGVPRGHMAWEDQLLNLMSVQYRHRDSWGSRMRLFN